MAAIAALAREYGFKVIEDASHAIGGRWQGEFIGGCQHSDITVFSFHPVKIITTAEGGLLRAGDQSAHVRRSDRNGSGLRDRKVEGVP